MRGVRRRLTSRDCIGAHPATRPRATRPAASAAGCVPCGIAAADAEGGRGGRGACAASASGAALARAGAGARSAAAELGRARGGSTGASPLDARDSGGGGGAKMEPPLRAAERERGALLPPRSRGAGRDCCACRYTRAGGPESPAARVAGRCGAGPTLAGLRRGRTEAKCTAKGFTRGESPAGVGRGVVACEPHSPPGGGGARGGHAPRCARTAAPPASNALRGSPSAEALSAALVTGALPSSWRACPAHTRRCRHTGPAWRQGDQATTQTVSAARTRKLPTAAQGTARRPRTVRRGQAYAARPRACGLRPPGVRGGRPSADRHRRHGLARVVRRGSGAVHARRLGVARFGRG